MTNRIRTDYSLERRGSCRRSDCVPALRQTHRFAAVVQRRQLHTPAQSQPRKRPRRRSAFSTGMTRCIRRITLTKPGIAPDCGMALVPMYESKTPAEQASAEAGLIHMPKSQQRALGVRLTTVEEQSVSRTLRTSGVVTADETRIAHVHVKTAGWVRRGLCQLCRTARTQRAGAVYRVQPGPGGHAAGVPDCAARTAAAWQIAV